MNVWVCSPQCNQLVKDATTAQARQIQAARLAHDYVIACWFVHPGKELTND